MAGGLDLKDARTRLSAPLLAGLGLPRYRFVPGRNPHPILDPAGHSYYPAGEPGLATDPVSVEAWHLSQDYVYGCDLYNHGYWWEAHESWEGIWRLAPRGGVLYGYLQGLIQVSAAHLQLFAGHIRGVKHLLPAFSRKLRATSESGRDRYMGIEIGGFSQRAEAYFRKILSKGAPYNHDIAAYPYLLLDMPPD